MSVIIRNYAQSQVKHIKGVMFQCGECNSTLPVKVGCGTGYGWKDTLPESKPICYDCCAKEDMRIMETGGKHNGLYFNGDYVTNWPGTLRIRISSRKYSWHNFAGKNGRVDFWFAFGGYRWHGVNIGKDNMLARCKRTKEKVKTA